MGPKTNNINTLDLKATTPSFQMQNIQHPSTRNQGEKLDLIFIGKYLYSSCIQVSHYWCGIFLRHSTMLYAYTERCWAMSSNSGIANIGSSFASKESLSLLVDLINACKESHMLGPQSQIRILNARLEIHSWHNSSVREESQMDCNTLCQRFCIKLSLPFKKKTDKIQCQKHTLS